ncbi:hypothetical protein [Nonomuraea pusilla]|uniref:Uncharacterized protein n=1 Tax=Nonomuraea pusilla TaxID=46177 RepID=A0A1H7V9P5_9ACTN|nr:hypothetical protein [Nonomuraea pusilla]SEM05477.1 hypothetical protein SAMN05660976_04037 [Nonomuraea pusilla]
MKLGLSAYMGAVAASTAAAYLIQGPAAWAVPVTIGAMACDPEGIDKVAKAWLDSASDLRDAHADLGRAAKGAPPETWDAEDGKAFETHATAFQATVLKSCEINQGAGQGLTQIRTLGQAGALLAATTSTALLTTGWAVAASQGALLGSLPVRVAAMRFAATINRVLAGSMRRQILVTAALAGILTASAAWTAGRRQELLTMVRDPAGGRPDFRPVAKLSTEQA